MSEGLPELFKKTDYKKPPGKVIDASLAQKIQSIDIEDFETEGVKEIFPPLCNIVFDLKEKIKEGKYSLVIGDDASGHVPALILYKFIREIYKEKQKKINIVFLSGSKGLNESDLENKKEKIKNLLKDKLNVNEKSGVLVATDVVFTGETLVPLRDVLNDMKVDYNISSISVLYEKDSVALEEKFDNKLIYGTYGELQSILGNSTLSGFEKSPEDIFAKRKKLTSEQEVYFRQGRKDIEIAVKKLTDFYESISK